jgi:putative transposase
MIPGYAWHITHRCHNRLFLLKLLKDKKNWMSWMYSARVKYGLHILNYAITSNHIHLIVYHDGRPNVIPRSMLLAASRTALEYNHRKDRSGAFWEGNYHATAVQTDSHLMNCMVYIDLNMVRARVVQHPRDWRFCGFQEITGMSHRRRLIDLPLLMKFLGCKKPEELQSTYQGWIEDALRKRDLERKAIWTESVAVGGKSFVEEIREKLGIKAIHKKSLPHPGSYMLKDPSSNYVKAHARS